MVTKQGASPFDKENAMGHYIDQGNFSFAQAVHDEIYVDKSPLIEHLNRMINTRRKFLCVTRPRRFGKSLAAQMLCAYYDRSCDSRPLFKELKIARDETFERYLNKFPVISLDVHEERSRVHDGMEFVPWLQNRILHELAERWPDCLADCKTVPDALASINEKTNAQFVITLDEWHSIYRTDEENPKAQEAWIEFLRALFKGQSADKYIALAYMTGVLPIRNYASESPLSNFDEYTIFTSYPLESCFGFTLDEVQALCSQYKMDFGEMKRWYDGYRIRGFATENGETVEKVMHICNPNSVVRAIMRREFECYWNDTGSLDPVRRFVQMDIEGTKSALVQMLSGGTCHFRQVPFNNTFNDAQTYDSVMTRLTHLGYIRYDKITREGTIPNEEIREAIYDIASAARWNGVLRSIEASEKFIDAIVHGNSNAVADILDKIHCDLASILTFNNENTLACVVMYACYTARQDFFVFRELPSGVGFVDIALIPLPSRNLPAVLVELKWDKNADTAIEQIHNRKYTSAFDNYNGEIVLAGINYNKDSQNKMHECKIERMMKE